MQFCREFTTMPFFSSQLSLFFTHTHTPSLKHIAQLLSFHHMYYRTAFTILILSCGVAEATGPGFVCFVIFNVCCKPIELILSSPLFFNINPNFTPSPTHLLTILSFGQLSMTPEGLEAPLLQLSRVLAWVSLLSEKDW